jgi:type IV pilus assembly protein PilC
MNEKIDIRVLSKGKKMPLDPHSRGNGAENGQPGTVRTKNAGVWDFLNRDVSLFGTGLPDKIKEGFYIELNALLAAGVDIRTALELIGGEQRKKKYKSIFLTILQSVTGGVTLSAALKKQGPFTPYEYYSVQIGEETGKLVIVLGELATFYKKKIDQKRQIIGALTYPVLVLVVAGFAVAFMMTYVVPMFADVLKRFGGDLPLITKMVLRLSVVIRKFSLVFFLFLFGIGTLTVSQWNKKWLRQAGSSLLLRIPVIGEIVRKIYLSRFANTMSLLIGSRIPLIQSIQLVRQMLRFYPVQESLKAVEEDVLAGLPLYKSLALHSVYPKKMISLVKVGEEVNQLDLFFGKISSQYASEVEYQTTLLSKFIEPLIIIVLGLVVGTILIAMYLPLFKLGQAV